MSDDSNKHDIDYPWAAFFRDMLSFSGKGRIWFALAVLVAIVNQVAGLYFPVFLGDGVNFLTDYQSGQGLGALYRVGAVLLGLSLLQIAAQRWSQWLSDRLAAVAAGSAFEVGIDNLLRLGGAWHAQENSGNKVKRVQTGSATVQRFYRSSTRQIVEMLVSVVGVILVVGQIDWWLSAGFLVFALVYGALSRAYIKKGSRMSHAENKEREVLSGYAFESINNIRTVQTGALVGPMYQRLSGQVTKAVQAAHARTQAFKVGGFPAHIFANLARIGMLAYAAHGVLVGRYDIGILIILIAFFGRVWHATIQFADFVTDILIMRYEAWRLMEVLQEDPYFVDRADAKKFPDTWKELQVSRVSFTYPEGEQVLKDVSFTLERGQKIGLVGLSGAGKSTLFKLLTREYQPTEGAIQIDGININDFTFESYFQNIGVMLQETELFNMSLKENIAPAGRVNKERFEAALRTAHVNEFLKKLPEGVKTLIGEKGFKLSGGERQRVGIARAIYGQPEILFFDEATSHLDTQSEKKIQDALAKVFNTTTAVVIAHRLHTIQEMDKILVLHRGKIAEEGTMQELISQKGRFYKLWSEQKL